MAEEIKKLETYHYIWSNNDAYIISHSKSTDIIKFVDETINNACSYLKKYAGPNLDLDQIYHAVRETLKAKLGKGRRPVDVFFSKVLRGRANAHLRKVFINEISFCVKDKFEGNSMYYSFINRIITLAGKNNADALGDFGILVEHSSGAGNEIEPQKPARKRKKSKKLNDDLRVFFKPKADPEARVVHCDARASRTVETHVPSSPKLPKAAELPKLPKVLKIKG